MMQAQKLLIFALIAGLLVLQLIPPTLGRGTGTPSASEETESETDTDTNSGGISATCGISIGNAIIQEINRLLTSCLLYTSPSPRDATLSRMPSSA